MKTFRYSPAELALLPIDMDPEWTAVSWDYSNGDANGTYRWFDHFFVVPGMCVERIQLKRAPKDLSSSDMFQHLDKRAVYGAHGWFETKSSKKHGSPLQYAIAETNILHNAPQEDYTLVTEPFLVDFTQNDLHLRMQETLVGSGKRIRTLGDATAYGHGNVAYAGSIGIRGAIDLYKEILNLISATRSDPNRRPAALVREEISLRLADGS